MACALTTGRTEPCKDAKSGLKAVYFADFVEDGFTVSGGEATAIDAAITEVFKYELNSNENTFDQNNTADNETGTTVYEQVLNVRLKKQGLATQNEIHLLHKGRALAVIEGRDGSYKVMGLEDGTSSSGNSTSGGAKNEFNGYNLTFTATETEPAPYLDSSTVTALLAIVSATNINP